MLVNIPDKGMVIKFPDDMDPQEVERQIYTNVYNQETLSQGTERTFFEKAKDMIMPPPTVRPEDKAAFEINNPYNPEPRPQTHPIERTEAPYQSFMDKANSTIPEAEKNTDILKYAPYMAVSALKGAMTPVLGPLKSMGMDTESLLNTAIEYWKKDLPSVDIPNAGIVKDENGDWDIQEIDGKPVSDLIGEVSEGAGFLGPASAALKGGGLVAEKLSKYARPFYRNILKGMIGGALLGEGKKDETLETMAMFGMFEGAGYALGKIPGSIQAIKNSNAYRKATIPERGLVIQSLEKTLERNPNMSEADLVKMSDRYFQEAMARRSTGETPSARPEQPAVPPDLIRQRSAVPEPVMQQPRPVALTEPAQVATQPPALPPAARQLPPVPAGTPVTTMTEPVTPEAETPVSQESEQVAGDDKGMTQPWENAPIERESDWYGTKIQVAGEKKTDYSGPATVTRVLNNGNLIEAIPEGGDTAFRFRANQVQVTDLKETQQKQESPKEDPGPEVKSTRPDPWEIAKDIARQGTDPQVSYGLYVKATGLKPEMDSKEWRKIYESVLPEVRAEQPTQPQSTPQPDTGPASEVQAAAPEQTKTMQPGKVEITGQKNKTVSIDMTPKQEAALAPKEQKKYLIDEIDAAIKVAPKYTGGRSKHSLEKNKEKFGTITIEVPGDGEFTILNHDYALNQFKKRAKGFPATMLTNKKVIPGKSTRPTGRRIMDFPGEYLKKYSPKPAPDFVESDGKAMYSDGWYSDTKYLIKMPKPKTKNQIIPMPKEVANQLINTQSNELYPASLGVEHYTNPTGDKSDNRIYLDVYSETMPSKKDFMNEIVVKPQLVDIVLKRYPKAKPFLRKDGLLYFKDKGENVAIIMRLSDVAAKEAKAMRPEPKKASSGILRSGPTKPETPGAIPTGKTFQPIPEGKRRTAIIKDLSKTLNVPIRTGKFRQKAAGIYKIKPKVIRLAKTNDFPTAIHEVGHHIQSLLGFPDRMPGEVRQMAYEGAKDINAEGFAEFLRYYITKPSKLKAEAPDFLKEFDDRLDQFPDVKNVMTKAKESWNIFQAASSVQKVNSFIAADQKKPRVTLDEVYAEVKDNLHPIRRAVEAAEKTTGKKIPDQDNPYIKARLARGWARKAEQFLRHQPFRYVDGEPVFQGKSLREILHKVEQQGERNLLDTYLIARRALHDTRIQRGFDGILSKEDFAQTVKELEPKFKKVAQELDEYNNTLLDYLADSGRISKDLAKEIRAKNLFYTPFYRLMDVGSPGQNFGQKSGNVFNPIKKLKGSSRDILSPTESILKNTYAIINSAERTRVGKSLLDLGNIEGMGALVERIPWPMKAERIRKEDFLNLLTKYGEFEKVTDIKKSEKILTNDLGKMKNSPSSKMEKVALEALKTRGWTEAEAKQVINRIKSASDETASQVIEKTVEKTTIMTVKEELGFDNMPDSVISTFRPDKQRVGTNETIFYENGKPVLVELDPWLHKAIANIEAGDINLFIKIASYPARWLRAGATTFSPEFPLRNPMRDQMTAFIQSEYGFVPGVDFLRGLYHMAGKTKLWQEFNASGAAHSTIVSIDRDYLRKNLQDLLKDDVKWISKNPLRIMQAFSEFTEEASRVSEFAKARRQGKSQETAGLAGREVSLDFGRQGGNAARSANMIAAFWNARIEGLDKMRRSFKKHPARTTLKAFLSVTVPSVILWLIQKDDPHYQELPPWRKTLFWNIAINGLDDKFDFFIPIPKPFEWGLLFGSIPVAALDWAYTKDPTQFKDTVSQIGKTLELAPIPTGAIPIAEWWGNKSYFFDRPIVPRDKEGLEPYLQYKGRTSETMKLASRMVKSIPGLKEVASPAKLDNLIMGYTAGAGRAALEGTDWLLETFGAVKTPPDPKMTASDIPGIRAFAVRFPSSSSRSIERFYRDYLKEKRQWESKKEEAGIRGLGVKGVNAANPKLAEMEKIAKALSVLRDMVHVTYESEMPSEEKTKALDNLYYGMINLSRVYYGLKPIQQEQ